MSTPARDERNELCDLFLEVGPDAPTLCAGWTARDLAAHLVVRESRPDAAGGILIPKLAPYGERVRLKVAARPWTELVDAVRQGPPRLSPMRIPAVDTLTNTLEFFVHLEDVRRAQAGWQPRALTDSLESTLRSTLSRGARLMVRKAPCGLTLTPTGGAVITAKKGSPSVDVAGDIGELVLFVYGRQAHSRVNLTGDPHDVERISTAKFGV